MNVGIKGRQDVGKTATMVALFLELCRFEGYSPSEGVGNVLVRLPGYTFLDNANLREYVHDMCVEGYRHKVILIDEIDAVFPARFWSSKKQTEALLGLWQDVKLFNWVLYTAHLGVAVDKLIRDVTQVIVLPEYMKAEDTIYLEIINGLDLVVMGDSIYPASVLFPYYDRWARVK